MTPEDWEGAAAELLDATCTTAPVDVFTLAAACGVEVRPGKRSRICLLDGIAHVDIAARGVRQQGLLAHELGHFALERSRLPQCEQGARYIAGALRLPRATFIADLARTCWSITALRSLHPHASATAIGVRITQVRCASATLIDPVGRQRPWRVTSSCARESAKTLSLLEEELAELAWSEQRELRADPLCVRATAPARSGHSTRGASGPSAGLHGVPPRDRCPRAAASAPPPTNARC